MTLNLAAAAAADPQYGWGKLVALIVAGAIFYAFTVGHARWKSTREDSSPADGQKSISTVKPQAKGDSDSSDSAVAVVVRPARELDQFMASRVGRQSSTQLVREARRRFKASEASAWRALRRAKGGQS